MPQASDASHAPWACGPIVGIGGGAAALFLLGSWKGRVTGRSWRRDGVQLVAIAGFAALAAALIGMFLRVS